MTMRFKVCPHGLRNEEVVEVWVDDQMVAAIYPGRRDDELRIVSKYLMAATIDETQPPPVVNVLMALI